MNTPLQRERNYYLQHQVTLAELYEGRFVVIKDDVVLAIYNDAEWASPQSKKRYGGASYFVQRVAAPVRQ